MKVSCLNCGKDMYLIPMHTKPYDTPVFLCECDSCKHKITIVVN
jgi:hypothetical protein